jgi:hypothetical protein
MNFTCEDQNEEAPRIGCRCRECYRAREMSLDPRLLALVRSDRFGVMQPSKSILHAHLMRYLAGDADYGALYIGIIKALMEQLDQQFERELAMAARSVPVHFFPTTPTTETAASLATPGPVVGMMGRKT